MSHLEERITANGLMGCPEGHSDLDLQDKSFSFSLQGPPYTLSTLSPPMPRF